MSSLLIRYKINGNDCWSYAVEVPANYLDNSFRYSASGIYANEVISEMESALGLDFTLFSTVKIPVFPFDRTDLQERWYNLVGKFFPGVFEIEYENPSTVSIQGLDVTCSTSKSDIPRTISGGTYNRESCVVSQDRYYLPIYQYGRESAEYYVHNGYRIGNYCSQRVPIVFLEEGSIDGNRIKSNSRTVTRIFELAWTERIEGYELTIFSGSVHTLDSVFNDFTFEEFSPGSPVNPYQPGGNSGTGGGNGSFDDDSDLISMPPIPTLSSANTGFTRIYNPTLSQVQDLARYLWTDDSVIQTIWNHIKQFFENPMDAIIGFNLVPVPVPDGGTKSFALMYIDTGVDMTVAASQFVDVDCGTLEIKEYYGSALDYSPYTKIACYLPYIGTVSLNVDEVMGKTLHVVYRVDICSGSCVAYVLVNENAIYQYSGHCAIPIPLASADFSSYVNAAISIAKLAGTAIAAGAAGIGAAAAVSEAEQATNQIVTYTETRKTMRNPETGRHVTDWHKTTTQTTTYPQENSSTRASYGGLTPQNVANTVGEVISSKPIVEHSGGFSGNSGYLGVRRPFVIIERPNMCMPENYQALNGFPCMVTMELASCTGFTRVQQVQLTGCYATNPEQAEILSLLKMGVIL